MTDNCKKLFDLLSELPPDINKIEAFVVDNKLTSEEVTIALFEFIDDNQYEDLDIPPIENEIPTDCHMRYLYQLTELLLKHGLNPNMVYDGSTLAKDLQYIGFPYIAADVMQLLLDNGADISIVTEGEDVFQSVDSEVFYWFDDASFGSYFPKGNYIQRLNSIVHLWFVIVATMGDDLSFITTYDGFSVKELKNHRLYDFTITLPENGHAGWNARIFDKITKREVAMVK